MAETKHTPGPWRIEADIRSEHDHDYLAGWNIVSDAGEIVGIEGIIPSDRAEADARLIAAAPSLLEALQNALAAGLPDAVATAARSALALVGEG